jgi:uncharacterized protein (DUF1778 family)
MSQSEKPDHRLEISLSSEQKYLFERAAELDGASLTEFVIASLQAAAIAKVNELSLCLQGEASEVFTNLVTNPPEPNESARAAAARYRKLVGF